MNTNNTPPSTSFDRMQIEFTKFDDDGLTLIAALATVMHHFAEIPEEDKAAALCWFWRRYRLLTVQERQAAGRKEGE